MNFYPINFRLIMAYSVLGWLENAGKYIWDGITSIGTSVSNAFSGVALSATETVIKDALSAVLTVLAGMSDAVNGMMSSLFSTVADIATMGGLGIFAPMMAAIFLLIILTFGIVAIRLLIDIA